jgi:hypothetical protein
VFARAAAAPELGVESDRTCVGVAAAPREQMALADWTSERREMD